jgi:hypothetical protein
VTPAATETVHWVGWIHPAQDRRAADPIVDTDISTSSRPGSGLRNPVPVDADEVDAARAILGARPLHWPYAIQPPPGGCGGQTSFATLRGSAEAQLV